MSELPLHPQLRPWNSKKDAIPQTNEGRSHGEEPSTEFIPQRHRGDKADGLRWQPQIQQMDRVRALPTAGTEEYIMYVHGREDKRELLEEHSDPNSAVEHNPTVEEAPVIRTVDAFSQRANGIIDTLAQQTDEMVKISLKRTLLEQAILVVSSQESHSAIRETLGLVQLGEDALFAQMFEQLAKPEIREISYKRSELLFDERSKFLETQPFKTLVDQRTSEQLLKRYQALLCMKALGNFMNHNQFEFWLAQRSAINNEVKGFVRELLYRDYDTLDVARLLRIITAPPHVQLLDNVIR